MSTQALPINLRVDRDGRPVPRWASFAAQLVPLVTLPSGLWRIALVCGLSMGMLDNGGAVMLQAIWAFAFRDFPTLGEVQFTHDGWHVLLVACYTPLLLWAPLLGAVTYAYYRRRCRD